MKQVIYIDKEKEQEEKPVEFTHYLNGNGGWMHTNTKPKVFSKIVYLGKCGVDGDMFSVNTSSGAIAIYKGHLNSGKY